MKSVQDVMTKDVITLREGSSLHEAERLLRKYNIRHLPVVRGDKITGLFSKTDLMRLCFSGQYGEVEDDIDQTLLNGLTVGDVMIRKVITVAPQCSVGEAAELLAEHSIHALPVVSDGVLRGIVSSTDIIRHLLRTRAH